MNIEQIRLLFPVTQEAIYLSSATQAPLNTLVNARLQASLKTELNLFCRVCFLPNRAPISLLILMTPENMRREQLPIRFLMPGLPVLN